MKQMQKRFLKKNLYLNNLKANLNKWADVTCYWKGKHHCKLEIFYTLNCSFNVVSHKIPVRIFGYLIASKIHLEEEMC